MDTSPQADEAPKTLNIFEKEPEVQAEPTEQQIRKEDNTVFVGNIPNKATKKDVQKFFQKYGFIEKLWVRSVQVEESKLDKRASVILKKVHC